MKNKVACKNCLTKLRNGQKFCDLCGVIVSVDKENDFEIECETHTEQRANGICVICSKPVCSECEVQSAGKILCNDPEHRILLQEWSVMYEPDSEFEAKAVVRNLADGGIEAKSFSLHDHIATYGLGENRVRVFVRKSENEKAKALLKELNLTDED